MDFIQKPDELSFVSKEISVSEFFHEAIRCFSSSSIASTSNVSVDGSSVEDVIAAKMGCSSELVNELASVCSVDRLHVGWSSDDVLEAALPEATSLRTLQLMNDELKRRESSLTYRQQVSNILKYKRYNFKSFDGSAGETESVDYPLSYVPDDIVLSVSFTRPYNKPLEQWQIRQGRLLVLDMSFNVLGKQFLTELRDVISCQSDFCITQDYSDNPDLPQDILARDIYKSGFFYINGTFYNDRRHESSQDLSECVIQWASQGRRKNELGPFHKAEMSQTRFCDLKLRLGLPYLYQHQGSCQHLMIFHDMRLIHPDDKQGQNQYPVQVTSKIRKRVACCACKIYTAKWVTYGNGRVPFDPAFFCDICFRAFNYDDGKKIGDFRAYPYIDKHALG